MRFHSFATITGSKRKNAVQHQWNLNCPASSSSFSSAAIWVKSSAVSSAHCCHLATSASGSFPLHFLVPLCWLEAVFMVKNTQEECSQSIGSMQFVVTTGWVISTVYSNLQESLKNYWCASSFCQLLFGTYCTNLNSTNLDAIAVVKFLLACARF